MDLRHTNIHRYYYATTATGIYKEITMCVGNDHDCRETCRRVYTAGRPM